jgi:hypothetical protein
MTISIVALSITLFSTMTLSITTISIVALSITRFSTMTLSIMTISIVALSITIFSTREHLVSLEFSEIFVS